MDAAKAVHAFVVESSRAFHQANPWFDNSKLAAYQNVESLVRVPPVYHIFRNLSDVADWTPKGRFAMKADSGHSAKAVWVCEPTSNGEWRDHIRRRRFSADGLREAAVDAIADSRTHVVFIEELLQLNCRIALDFKVYVSGGHAVLLLLIQRCGTELQVQFFDRNLMPLKLECLFNSAEVQQFASLPSFREAELTMLARLGEQMSIQHSAPFCRYDFLLADDGGWFGEISPMCGGLMYWQPTAKCARIVLGEQWDSNPGMSTASFTEQVERAAIEWIRLNPTPTINAFYFRRFLRGTDLPERECPYSRFMTLAGQQSAKDI
jgi:hypothetical protein